MADRSQRETAGRLLYREIPHVRQLGLHPSAHRRHAAHAARPADERGRRCGFKCCSSSAPCAPPRSTTPTTATTGASRVRDTGCCFLANPLEMAVMEQDTMPSTDDYQKAFLIFYPGENARGAFTTAHRSAQDLASDLEERCHTRTSTRKNRGGLGSGPLWLAQETDQGGSSPMH